MVLPTARMAVQKNCLLAVTSVPRKSQCWSLWFRRYDPELSINSSQMIVKMRALEVGLEITKSWLVF